MRNNIKHYAFRYIAPISLCLLHFVVLLLAQASSSNYLLLLLSAVLPLYILVALLSWLFNSKCENFSRWIIFSFWGLSTISVMEFIARVYI